MRARCRILRDNIEGAKLRFVACFFASSGNPPKGVQESIMLQESNEKKSDEKCKSQGWVTLNGSQDGSILRVNTEIWCSFVKTSTSHGVMD